ncbi:hypothetical protein [Spiroplasma alleghenense]|uniref:Uncharacterized protein n=1 Tax=Spiroplasma alleghenense TaxID=216931 RepID=A0A345Z4W6_9MOLU|nr:hypothetical protein [Spiroplasma alleghenense]AXK51645.1 hypothetical protein SALLE_v1c09750 [Spiroplasma alleghenense]
MISTKNNIIEEIEKDIESLAAGEPSYIEIKDNIIYTVNKLKQNLKIKKLFKGILDRFLSLIIDEMKFIRKIAENEYYSKDHYRTDSDIVDIFSKFYTLIDLYRSIKGVKNCEIPDIDDNEIGFFDTLRNMYTHLFTHLNKKKLEYKRIVGWIDIGIKNKYISKYDYWEYSEEKDRLEIKNERIFRKKYKEFSTAVLNVSIHDWYQDAQGPCIKIIIWIEEPCEHKQWNKLIVFVNKSEIFEWFRFMNKSAIKVFEKIEPWFKEKVLKSKI